jgi:hypothetical protein
MVPRLEPSRARDEIFVVPELGCRAGGGAKPLRWSQRRTSRVRLKRPREADARLMVVQDLSVCCVSTTCGTLNATRRV